MEVRSNVNESLSLINYAPHNEDLLRSGGTAPLFLTPALNGGERPDSRLYRFTPGETAPGTHCVGDFFYCQTVAGLLMWRALSDERTGLSFTIDSGPRQRNHF
jgi:hypothetical protein